MVITKRILSSILFMGIAGGIFYFMFRQIVTDWPLIASYPWKITWLPMISSLGLAIIASALAIKAAHILCSVLGGKVSFPRFLYIFCLTQVGRYLPGKFWHLVSFAMLIEREKVKRSVSIVLPFLFQGIMIAIFWLVGTILCGPFIKGRLIPDFSWLAYLSAFVILFVLLFLPFLTGLLNHLINLKYKEVKYFYLPRKGYYTALSFLF